MKTLEQLAQPDSTLQDFIEFFSAIPEEKWTVGQLVDSEGRCCARGLLGTRSDMAKEEFYQSPADRRLTELLPGGETWGSRGNCSVGMFKLIMANNGNIRSGEQIAREGAKQRVLDHLTSL